MNRGYFESEEAFEKVAFYYPLNRYFAKRDPRDEGYSIVSVRTEDGDFHFRLENDVLDSKQFEYDLDIVYSNRVNE